MIGPLGIAALGHGALGHGAADIPTDASVTAPRQAFAGFASVLRFRGIRASTRGLIAAPWTPASLSLLPRVRTDRACGW